MICWRLSCESSFDNFSDTNNPNCHIIQIGTGADPGIYFGGPNQGPQSKVEGEARIEGAKRPSIEGEARVEGAKRPRIEGEARPEGKARQKSGGRGLGRGLGEPLPRKFLRNQT